MPYKIKSTGQQFQNHELIAQFPHANFALPLTQDVLDALDLEVLPDDPMTPEELAAEQSAELTRAKVNKNSEINAARLTANFTTFTHAGKLIACDQLSRSDIDATNGFVAIYGGLPPGWPGGWKAVDNSYVTIADVAGWKAFYASMFSAGNANFSHAQALKLRLSAAVTLELVADISW